MDRSTVSVSESNKLKDEPSSLTFPDGGSERKKKSDIQEIRKTLLQMRLYWKSLPHKVALERRPFPVCSNSRKVNSCEHIAW